MLVKLRSGHFIGLRAYKNRIDRVTDPICHSARRDPQDVGHWSTRCPATATQRCHLFRDYNRVPQTMSFGGADHDEEYIHRGSAQLIG